MNNNMLPDDIPPDNWLRDSLYTKIRNSHLMMFDIKQYESWDDDDARKTYRHLRNVIERTIARVKEDKQTNARDKYARDYAGSGKPTIPAPTTPTPKAGNDAAPAPKAKEKATPKPKPKADAAPVLPAPQPKQHAKGKGKGKGTPRSNSRSASPSPKDKKKIPCHYHFVKNSCKHGKDCLFSHDPKVFENYKKGGGKGKGKSNSPRKRTPSNPPKKIDEPCWNWAKGNSSMVTHVEGVMILICSTLLRTPVTRLHRPWYMTSTVIVMRLHVSMQHPSRELVRVRCDLM